METHFAVLNPGGRDKTQLFAHGAGLPSDPGHPPVNYHAYAACYGSGFYREAGEIPKGVRAVLVLLRKNSLGTARLAIRALKKRSISTFISWKESGLHQIAEALSDSKRYVQFTELCSEADGYLSSTPDLLPLYEKAGCCRGAFIPTPYPLDVPAWDFSLPVAERAGIFIGTREFDVPSRNHLLALSTACRLGVPVTVINQDGRKGERLLNSLSPLLQIVSGRLPYAEYLRVLARHRLVFQLDRSAVPGQVAGDALLCRIPCIGGDGAIDRLAFPNAQGCEISEIVKTTSRLLTDDSFYSDTVALSQRMARSQAGFVAVRDKITQLAKL